jgi:DNA-binding NtrC family response regulator
MPAQTPQANAMTLKKLLCIAPHEAAHARAECASLAGWDVHVAASVPEAARALRADGYLVGLLFGLVDEAGHGALERLLCEHWRVRWIGAFEPGALELERCRQLVADHLTDFHTLPLDLRRLDHTLGHALGCAGLGGPLDRALAPSAHALVGSSAAIAALRRKIAKMARADAPVLICGESGSGKELTALALHAQSARADGPFVPINCGAIPAGLIQSELFGHARGAFTGAAKDKPGLIESAAGGTVFLDEIADLPMDMQSSLLRFLQEKTLYRVGSTRSIDVDVRVLAASHVELQGAVARGQFREDLYYRLNVLPLQVPPLRERKEDLPMLAQHFFDTYAADRPARLKGFSKAAVNALCAHDWPGNVRELINRTRRALVLAEGRLIQPHDLGLVPHPLQPSGSGLGESRQRAEQAAIRDSLERAGGNVSQAARELGISRMTLYRLLSRYAISHRA